MQGLFASTPLREGLGYELGYVALGGTRLLEVQEVDSVSSSPSALIRRSPPATITLAKTPTTAVGGPPGTARACEQRRLITSGPGGRMPPRPSSVPPLLHPVGYPSGP